MKKPHFDPTGAIRGGAYSVVITAVVLAILIALNVAVAALPASATEYDISASKLYSVTSNTKSVVNALTDDVTIYWIVQAGQEDAVIEKLLDRYEGLSDHITVEKRNPDVYPTFAEEYIDEDDTVYNNSLVVECGERSRYIPYTDIYVTDADMYSYYYSTGFDGEGAITSAIDYVTNPDQPAAYTLTGHGESALPATFADSLEKENITVEELSSTPTPYPRMRTRSSSTRRRATSRRRKRRCSPGTSAPAASCSSWPGRWRTPSSPTSIPSSSPTA